MVWLQHLWLNLEDLALGRFQQHFVTFLSDFGMWKFMHWFWDVLGCFGLHFGNVSYQYLLYSLNIIKCLPQPMALADALLSTECLQQLYICTKLIENDSANTQLGLTCMAIPTWQVTFLCHLNLPSFRHVWRDRDERFKEGFQQVLGQLLRLADNDKLWNGCGNVNSKFNLATIQISSTRPKNDKNLLNYSENL